MIEATAQSQAQVQAAIRARDGWLFVGMAHVGLLGLVPVVTGLTQFAKDDPFSVLSVVGFSAWVVLGIVGSVRLYQARRAGHVLIQNKAGRIAWWIARWLIVLVLLMAAFIILVLPRWEWAVPVALSVFYVFIHYRTADRLAVAKWQVLLSYAVMAFGLSVWFWNSTLRAPRPMNEVLAVGAMVLVWMYLGLHGSIQSCRNRAPAWLAWMLVYAAFALTLTARFFTEQQSFSGRMAVSVLPLPVLVSAAMWWLFGRRPAWLRAGVTVVALAVGLVAAIMAVMAATAFSAQNTSLDDYRPDREFAWHLPEPIRTPLTRAAGFYSPRAKEICAALGLSSTDDIKAQLHISPEYIVRWIWTTLRLRDPDFVYQAAYAVPVNPLPSLDSVTRYDYMAGVEIAWRGSVDDIRQRLQQPYSNNLKAGLLLGLKKRTKAEREALFDDVMNLWQTLPVTGSSMPGWIYGVFMSEFLERSLPVLEAALTTPSGVNINQMTAYHAIISEQQDPRSLILKMLNSPNVEARKFAMVRFDDKLTKNDLLPIALQMARGTLPNSDPDEQRIAGEWLIAKLELDLPHALNSSSQAPLSTAEELWLKLIVGIAIMLDAAKNE